MQSDEPLYTIDLFTGIGGFHIAAKDNPAIETLMAAEIDTFAVKHIENNLDLENAGSVTELGVLDQDHSCKSMVDADLVPVEETGFSPLCYQDIMEGVVPWPRMVTGGFPCQDVSSANLQGGAGIDGQFSSLVKEQLRIMEDFEIEVAVFENGENLTSKGLCYILSELDKLGYCVEYETVSATAFGYPHYRHRVYIVAYLKSSDIFKGPHKIMALLRSQAMDEPVWKLSLMDDPESVLDMAVAEETRSIKLRTRRINALGNSVIPDIPKAIFKAITDALGYTKYLTGVSPSSLKDSPGAYLKAGNWYSQSMDKGGQQDLFSLLNAEEGEILQKLPRRGVMVDGVLHSSSQRCEKLDPVKTKYKHLFSTLIRKDGNNNFTTKSRLNRPGKLGGLVGDIMSLGADIGGLHPVFCERLMGYPDNFTDV